MATATRVCGNPKCDDTFTPRNSQHKFCSDACRKEAWRVRKLQAVRDRISEEVTALVTEIIEDEFHDSL